MRTRVQPLASSIESEIRPFLLSDEWQAYRSCIQPQARACRSAKEAFPFYYGRQLPALSTITMAAPQRRVQPPVQQYYAVPQSPQNALRSQYSLPPQPMPQPPPQPQASSSYDSRTIPNNNDTTYGVATGAIGGGYGPYSVSIASSEGSLHLLSSTAAHNTVQSRRGQ